MLSGAHTSFVENVMMSRKPNADVVCSHDVMSHMLIMATRLVVPIRTRLSRLKISD